ncbi:hypothetical protein H9P43_003729 [Blastocladiella emersonii ATCC 22665]|nr:hypothetical protein H9P43_003729 [Blastocladiella emersonii ATCC 22665]
MAIHEHDAAARGGSDATLVFSSDSAAAAPGPAPPPPLAKRTRVQRAAQWAIFVVPAAVVCLAIGLAVYTHLEIRATEVRNVDQVYTFRCTQQAQRLRNDLQSQLVDPSLYFRTYVTMLGAVNQSAVSSFGDEGGISPFLRFVIMQRVLDADRAAWEAATGTVITVPNAINTSGVGSAVRRPDSAASVYWPVRYTWPRNDTIAGIDGAFGSRAVVLNRAIATGEYQISDVVPLVAPRVFAAPGIVLFTPPVDRAIDRTTWISWTGFNIVPYLESTMTPTARSSLVRMRVAINGTSVYRSPVPPNDPPDFAASHTEPILLGGQTFTLECAPSTALRAIFASGWAAGAPILVVVGGLALAALVHQILKRLQRLRATESLIGSWKGYTEAIMQATPNPMIMLDARGDISGVNEPLLALTGHTPGSVSQIRDLREMLRVAEPRSPPASRLFVRRGSTDPADEGVDVSDAFLAAQRRARAANDDETDDDYDEDDDDGDAQTRALVTPGRREVHVLRPAPGADPIDAMATVSHATGNSVVNQVIVITDLTEQRRRDRRLAELLRETELLTAQQRHLLLYLAHELRNPVYVIQGNVAAANGQDAPPVDREAVMTATEHMCALLDGVVEYIEVGAGLPRCTNSGAAIDAAVTAGSAPPVAPPPLPSDPLRKRMHVDLAHALALPPGVAVTGLDPIHMTAAALRALSKLDDLTRSVPGSYLSSIAVTPATPATGDWPGRRPPLTVTVTATLSIAVPDDARIQSVTAQPFNWTISGLGDAFHLLGLRLAILMRLAALAKGGVGVRAAQRQAVVTVPAWPCAAPCPRAGPATEA